MYNHIFRMYKWNSGTDGYVNLKGGYHKSSNTLIVDDPTGFSIGNSRSPIQTWSLQGRHFSSFGGFKVSDATGSRKSVLKTPVGLKMLFEDIIIEF